VVAQVTRMGATYFISAKLIDIKTGEIIAQASDEAQGDVAVNLRIAQAVGKKLASGTRESAKASRASPAPADLKQTTSTDTGPKYPRGGTTTSMCLRTTESSRSITPPTAPSSFSIKVES
jgi:hypothetical protein